MAESIEQLGFELTAGARGAQPDAFRICRRQTPHLHGWRLHIWSTQIKQIATSAQGSGDDVAAEEMDVAADPVSTSILRCP
jgi:hypothetical protein